MYVSEKNAKEIEQSLAETEFMLKNNSLSKDVSVAFFEYKSFMGKKHILHELDSMYSELLLKSEKRLQKGDITYLEVLNVRAKKNQAKLALNAVNIDIETAYNRLKSLMNYDADFTVLNAKTLLPIHTIIDTTVLYKKIEIQNKYAEALLKIEKNKMAPDISVNYYIGSNRYQNSEYYHGFELGIALPIFYGGQKAKIKAAKISRNAQYLLSENEISLIKQKQRTLLGQYKRNKALLNDYQTSEKALHDEIIRTSLKAYQLGEIDFYRFISSYETAVQLKLDYIDNVLKFNIVSTELLYFSNN